MGGVPLVMASNVWLRGSGRDVTVLQWTSVPPTGAITSVGGASGGFTHGGVTDLTLSFTSSAANASGFRFTTSDGDLGRVEYDTFQNIHILFSGYPGSQSAGFYITDSGSNTNFVLNTIDNVFVEQANQFAICGGCEGNFWTHLQCVNCGWTDRAELFEYAGLENDEVWDGRMEQGSNNQTNVTCLGFDKVREGGKGNIVRLVCDNIATGFAVHDSRNGSNMFLVTTVGGATLGKIRGSSQYSFVNLDAFTLSTAAPNLKAQHVDGCATAAFAGATCDIQVTWATPFTDANYSASCSGDHIASGVPIIQGVNAAGAKTAGAVTVRTYAMTAAAAQFEAIDCVAVHSQGN